MEGNYIYSNFGCILDYITKLETQNISLSEALSAIKYVQNKLDDSEGKIGIEVDMQKMQQCIE